MRNWNEAALLAAHGGGRSTCPECGGGRSRELCFTVYNRVEDDSWWGKCHRAACGVVKKLTGLIEEGDELPAAKPDRTYRGEVTECPAEVIEWALQRWPALVPNDFGMLIRWNPARKTLLCPIRDVLGRRVGYVEKCASPNWGHTPLASQEDLSWPNKVKTWHDDSDNKDALAWYGLSRSGLPLVLVEDQISAICLSGYKDRQVVALLGTGFNAARMSELQQTGVRDLVIALDADATAHAFKMAEKWGLAFDSVKVAILPRDFKDMTVSELEDFQI